MNAKELADELDECEPYNVMDTHLLTASATMLRLQADRIAELEKENSELKYEKSSGVYDNEPVAWMVIDVDNGKSLQFKENKFSEINIPLYTHPAKTLESLGAKFEKVLNDNLWELMEESPAKTLTDEEIEELGNKLISINIVVYNGQFQNKVNCIDFARAILKKASEK